jgi:kynurenine formamidase
MVTHSESSPWTSSRHPADVKIETTQDCCSRGFAGCQNVGVDCPECDALEAARYERTNHYFELTEARKIVLMEGRLLSPKLNEAIAKAETKLTEAWKRLKEHLGTHSDSPTRGA